MKTLPKILICDDDKLLHRALKLSLNEQFETVSVYNGDEALALLRKNSFQVVVLDIQMRTKDEGLNFIQKLKEIDPEIAIIMASGIEDFSTIKKALQLGADDYLIKGADVESWSLALNRAIEKQVLLKQTQLQESEAVRLQKSHVLIGKSPQIEVLRRQIARAKESSAHILISGETGTGKEVVARLLRKSGRDGTLLPFVAVDAATIQSTMAESMLFGYEKGAFTGADKMTRGMFEEANGGSIYFDELANMPIHIQNKLLRVIQEKEIVRLGSSRVVHLDFRVISATNKDLTRSVQLGEFKEDLLHRVNVIPLSLPPLRERKEDVPLLVEHFLRISKCSTRVLHFSEDAIQCLMNYSWPGNVRELSNLIQFLTSMAEDDEIQVPDLPAKFRDCFPRPAIVNSSERGFYEQVQIFEKKILSDAYGQFSGNITQLATNLGMDRSHLYHKLREYQIHKSKSLQA